jgi:hypothetical protein
LALNERQFYLWATDPDKASPPKSLGISSTFLIYSNDFRHRRGGIWNISIILNETKGFSEAHECAMLAPPHKSTPDRQVSVVVQVQIKILPDEKIFSRRCVKTQRNR